MKLPDLKKLPELENLSPLERRQFLKILSGVLAAPLIPKATREAVMDMVLGKAYAQQTQPINFLEVNFRDQWDWGHLFVPPSVAASYENIRSRIALFDAPIAERNGFFVTPQAQELRPHLDTIAVMELGECVLPGNQSIHGHEAGNPLRSPGRSKDNSAGKRDMATIDRRPGTGGNEILYSSSPTPMILHNYHTKMTMPSTQNGVILRSSVRSNTHTYYHFEGNLNNAQADRYLNKSSFLSAFNTTPTPAPQTALQSHGRLITQLMKRADSNYLNRLAASASTNSAHGAKLDALANLQQSTPPAPLEMELSAAEQQYWQNGISAQLVCPGDNASNCTVSATSWTAGELFAYAFKLFQSGRVRSVAIDFDIHDVHSDRNPLVMNTMAQQSGLTLARLIQSLKLAGLYDTTLIAMYTLDGGRSPLRNSTGEDTKNGLILAGGMIRGGYYGDIQVSTSGVVTYRRPNDLGQPIAAGTTGRDMRVPAADVYKTVAKAAGLPDSLVNSLPDVQGGRVLNYMLR